MKNCIGIIKERLYRNEKRVALTPGHVAKLVQDHGTRVVVEPSEKRCFPDEEYAAAGATVSPDLSECNLHYERNPNPRLRVIADITCDVEGSIELTAKTTDSGEDSLYVYEPLKGKVKNGGGGRGPVILAIDTLPSELPREASTAFGDALMPFVPDLAAADYADGHVDELSVPSEVRKAVIVHAGELTRRFDYLNDALSKAS